MRDVVSQDGSRLLVIGLIDDDGEDDEQALRELVVARLRRACDAATVALTIMTSYKMPKQVCAYCIMLFEHYRSILKMLLTERLTFVSIY